MGETAEAAPTARSGQYDAAYGNFETDLYERIRREAFGEDIGQNSWLTADEYDTFAGWLDLSSGKVLLDIGCGAGGPALRIAAATGCSVVGVDVHAGAVSTARRRASSVRLNVALPVRSAPKNSASSRAVNLSGSVEKNLVAVCTVHPLPDRARMSRGAPHRSPQAIAAAAARRRIRQRTTPPAHDEYRADRPILPLREKGMGRCKSTRTHRSHLATATRGKASSGRRALA